MPKSWHGEQPATGAPPVTGAGFAWEGQGIPPRPAPAPAALALAAEAPAPAPVVPAAAPAAPPKEEDPIEFAARKQAEHLVVELPPLDMAQLPPSAGPASGRSASGRTSAVAPYSALLTPAYVPAPLRGSGSPSAHPESPRIDLPSPVSALDRAPASTDVAPPSLASLADAPATEAAVTHVVAASHAPLPTDLQALRQIVQDEVRQLRLSMHQEIQNLHLDMLRQFQLQRVRSA